MVPKGSAQIRWMRKMEKKTEIFRNVRLLVEIVKLELK